MELFHGFNARFEIWNTIAGKRYFTGGVYFCLIPVCSIARIRKSTRCQINGHPDACLRFYICIISGTKSQITAPDGHLAIIQEHGGNP